MIRISVDESLLSAHLDTLSDKINKIHERLLKSQNLLSLLDYQRTAPTKTVMLQSIIKQQQYQSSPLLQNIHQHLKKQLMQELTTYINNRIDPEQIQQSTQVQEEVRKLKFRLETFTLSAQRKISYIREKMEELMQPKWLQTVQTQCQIHIAPFSQPDITVKEIKFKNSSLNEVIEHLQSKVDRQESVNDNAYQRLAVRMADVEKHIKNLMTEPKVMIRQNSRDKLNKDNESIRKDLVYIREELAKTNEKMGRLSKTTERLTERLKDRDGSKNLEVRQHSCTAQPIPLETIKEIMTLHVNKILEEPFDQRFTTTLKNSIEFRFLQIKHELISYMRQIEQKVQDKVDGKHWQNSIDRVSLRMEGLQKAIESKADHETIKTSLRKMEGKLTERNSARYHTDTNRTQ